MGDDSWTQYQKLVLAELEGHDKRLDNLQKELTEIKIAQAETSAEVRSMTKSISESSIRIQEAINTVSGHKLDIAVLKLKIYGVVSALSAVVALSVQSLFKYFTGNH